MNLSWDLLLSFRHSNESWDFKLSRNWKRLQQPYGGAALGGLAFLRLTHRLLFWLSCVKLVNCCPNDRLLNSYHSYQLRLQSRSSNGTEILKWSWLQPTNEPTKLGLDQPVIPFDLFIFNRSQIVQLINFNRVGYGLSDEVSDRLLDQLLNA